MISQELEPLLHRAFSAASRNRHQEITVEYLLLYLLDSVALAERLTAQGVDVADVRTELAETIMEQPTIGEPDVKPYPNKKFQEVIQAAILRAQRKGRKEVSTPDLFDVLLDPNYRSVAVELLEECGPAGVLERLRSERLPNVP